MSPAPTFVVAGAGRAGTTGLVESLRRHPDVFVTTPKEPHYLAFHDTTPDFRGPGDEAFNRSVITREDAYRDLYSTGSHRLALGEGSVSTLYHHQRAVTELVRLNPTVRVVVLLREPVDRAWSSFQYLRAQGREPEQDFLTALEDEHRRRAQNWHHLWHYTEMSRYAEAIADLQDRLMPGHLGVWFHDDLERDLPATLDQVRRFLGLPEAPGLGEDVPRVNISGTPRYARVQQALNWASREPVLRRSARVVTSWQFREAMRSRLIRRGTVPESVVSEVAPRFEDDLARLRELLPSGTRLPAWLAETGTRAR